MQKVRPLLIFDSGIGGLSVLQPIQALLPTAPIVYVADSAGYPYGTKSESEIAARVPALLGRLAERFDPELIVIACNTASTIALDHVRAALDVPIVGTVPAIKPAAALSQSRVIGVLGTEATVRQAYVDRLAAEFAPDCLLIRHGSAELVDLAEAKLRGEAPDPSFIPASWPDLRTSRRATGSTRSFLPALTSRWWSGSLKPPLRARSPLLTERKE
jgi:glutamate racemase